MLNNYLSQAVSRSTLKKVIPALLIMSFFSCKEKFQEPDNNQTEPQTSIVSTIAGKFLLQKDKVTSPIGIVVDHQGNVFIADHFQYHIRKITPDGKSSIFAGSATCTIGFKDGEGKQALSCQLLKRFLYDLALEYFAVTIYKFVASSLNN